MCVGTVVAAIATVGGPAGSEGSPGPSSPSAGSSRPPRSPWLRLRWIHRIFIGTIVLIAGAAAVIMIHSHETPPLFWKGVVRLSADENFGVSLDVRPPQLNKGKGADLVLNGAGPFILVATGQNKVGILSGPSAATAAQCVTQLTTGNSLPKVPQGQLREGDSVCLKTHEGRLVVIYVKKISPPTAIIRGLSAEAYVYDRNWSGVQLNGH